MAKDKKSPPPQQMTVLRETGVTVQEESFLPADVLASNSVFGNANSAKNQPPPTGQGPALVDIRIPQPAPITDGTTMLNRIKELAVTDAGSYEMCAQIRASCRNRWSAIEQERVKMKEPALESGRRVDAFFKPVLTAFQQAGEMATTKLNAYDEEQRRIAAEKQRVADEVARNVRERIERQAREERERQAEAQRVQERAEAARKTEEQRIAREAAEAKANEERARREAAEAAAAGDRVKAEQAQLEAANERQKAIEAKKEQLRAEEAREIAETENRRLQQASEARARQLEQQASAVVATKVETETVEVAGLSRAKVWKWKLKDRDKLADQFLLVDEKSISRIVTAMKERAHEVVGVGAIEIYQDTNLRQERI